LPFCVVISSRETRQLSFSIIHGHILTNMHLCYVAELHNTKTVVNYPRY